MDRITSSLLNEFAAESGLSHLPEDKLFEHFSSYVTLRKHHSQTFDTEDIVTGSGDDTGIDGIGILVNGFLITDVDGLDDIATQAGYLEVVFVFVQAETSSGFDGGKIGTFGFGVSDFFRTTPTLRRNAMIMGFADTMAALYGKHSSKFRNNPACHLYYVTTGKWVTDQTLDARRQHIISDLSSTGLFSSVSFTPVDAEHAQRLYRQTKNAVSRTFNFTNRTVAPEVPGVTEAHLGYLPAKEFLKLLTDEDGDMLTGLFYDNVRDFQDYNMVNSEIRQTLETEARERFVLMNNGVTIVARRLKPVGNSFTIEDYTIVNGCQTSHVLFDARDSLTDRVMVPVRLIGTADEGIIHAIIKSTNRQTEVKEDQFFSTQEFPKQLEAYFATYDEQYRLYYERRSMQYNRLSIEKTRIVTPANLIRSFASMFLNEPHRTTRNYAALSKRVGKDIFAPNHRLEPYYAAAYSLYKLEYAFRNRRLEPKYKPARFHILTAMRMLAVAGDVPERMNSREMERYAKSLIDALWDARRIDDLIAHAARVVESAAAGDFNRDTIRTEPFTQKVILGATDVKDSTAPYNSRYRI